jgi:hypothetical protein
MTLPTRLAYSVMFASVAVIVLALGYVIVSVKNDPIQADVAQPQTAAAEEPKKEALGSTSTPVTPQAVTAPQPQTTLAQPSVPTTGTETTTAELPDPPSPARWDLIWGLSAKADSESPSVVSGWRPLQLIAVPTVNSDAQNRHALALASDPLLGPPGLYRVTVWVNPTPGINIQIQIRDSVDPQTGKPANEGEVRFNLSSGSAIMTSGRVLAEGAEPAARGWQKVWVDINSSDGKVYVYLGLLERGSNTHVFKGTGEQILLGGIEITRKI